MYFSSTNYPAMRGKDKRAVTALVTAALRQHDRWAKWRFWGVLALLLTLSIGLAAFDEALQLPDWFAVAVALSGGLVFWVYLLWEINGPMHRAVQKYLAGSGDADQA
jgi:peptidoglycan/LPS O-acetylase OafA/YrhL